MDSKNNTANSMDKTLKQFSKIMLTHKIFDCAICEKLLTPPIMLIENTSNICSNCFKKMNENKNAIRNVPFEKILAETIVPCDYGCKEDIVYKELEEHHAECKCRPVKCLVEYCQQLHPVNNYVKHFTEKHSNQIFDNDDGIFLVNISCDGNHLKLLKEKNNQFVLNVTNNTKTNNILFSIFTENSVNDNNGAKKCNIKLCGMNNMKMNIVCEIQPLRNISDENKATKVSKIYLENLIGCTNVVTLMIKSNDNELSNVFKKLYMECPVCSEILRPPIYLCTTGHRICKNCQSKMSHCPTCREALINKQRNYSLEDMTKQLLYECMYRKNGCQKKLPGDQINKHEETCGFNNRQRYNTETQRRREWDMGIYGTRYS